MDLRLADRNSEIPGHPPQLCQNYIVKDREGQSDWPTRHVPRPALAAFSTVGSGPIRGVGFSPKVLGDNALVISGSEAYKVSSAGTATKIGDVDAAHNNELVDITFCRNEAVVVDTTKVFKVTTSAVTEITDGDLPSTSSVTYMNGLTIFGTEDNDRYYWSALLDSTDIDALDFATAERKPDRLTKALADNDQLWLFGERGTEVHAPTSDADLPIQRIEGVDLQKGLESRDAVVAIDNALIWPGHDRMVYRADGYAPRRVSDDDVDARLRALTEAEAADLRAFGMIWDGHSLYVLTSPGNWTCVLDIRTGRWWRWSVNGRDDFPIVGYAFAFGKHLLADARSNKLYALDSDAYSDSVDGTIIRTVTALAKLKGAFSCESIGVYGSRGVGSLTDEAEMMLSYSDDQGKTFTGPRFVDLGLLGEYETRPVERGLGLMRPPFRLFKTQVSSDADVQLDGLRINEPEY